MLPDIYLQILRALVFISFSYLAISDLLSWYKHRDRYSLRWLRLMLMMLTISGWSYASRYFIELGEQTSRVNDLALAVIDPLALIILVWFVVKQSKENRPPHI